MPHMLKPFVAPSFRNEAVRPRVANFFPVEVSIPASFAEAWFYMVEKCFDNETTYDNTLDIETSPISASCFYASNTPESHNCTKETHKCYVYDNRSVVWDQFKRCPHRPSICA